MTLGALVTVCCIALTAHAVPAQDASQATGQDPARPGAPNAAQPTEQSPTTRTELIEQAQAEKAKSLTPAGPDKAEEAVARLFEAFLGGAASCTGTRSSTARIRAAASRLAPATADS